MLVGGLKLELEFWLEADWLKDKKVFSNTLKLIVADSWSQYTQYVRYKFTIAFK